MPLPITHDIKHQMFVVTVDEHKCMLKYYKKPNNTLDFYSTYVPPELRGKKIAAELVEYGLNYAKDNNFTVIPSCPYVKRYIESRN